MMHSSVAVVPPQGAALLLELGTLIMEGRARPRPRRPEPEGEQEQGATAAGGEGPAEDTHRKVLVAKLLGVKIYQRAQFGKEDEEERVAPHQQAGSSSSPARDPQTARGRLLALRGHAEALWREHIPLCIEALLAPECGSCRGPLVLVERWTMSIYCKRAQDPSNHITSQWLLNAVRSQLHFSQISAWSAKIREEQKTKEMREQSPSERQRKLSRETCNFKKYESNLDEEDKEEKQDKKLKNLNVVYCLKIPGETYRIADFKCEPIKHTFPITDIGSDVYLKVLLESLPRLEDVPLVRCGCVTNNLGSLKRRRSKDMMNGAALSEEALASSLAAACSLAEDKACCSRVSHLDQCVNGLSDDCKTRIKGATFSPDLGIINPDKGCASGISRKFTAYTTPDSDVYLAPNSRGSTPEHSDLNDSGFSCSTGAPCEGPLHWACKRKSKLADQLYNETNMTSLDNMVRANFVLVDDRMQTPCRQKGKHRCNCDEESDQGSQLKEQGKNTKHVDFYNVEEKVEPEEKVKVLDEKRAKEIAKYMRRLRKEARLKMRESGQSSQENSECKDHKQENSPRSKSGRRATSRHNDLNSNKNFIDDSKDHLEHTVPEESSKKIASEAAKVRKPSPKSSDSHSATSIAILQASRFDHANRMGHYRNSVSLHGALSSREIYSIKDADCICSSIGCDQMASVKSCSQFGDGNSNTYHIRQEGKRCLAGSRHPDDASTRFSSDNYQPSVKKLISSCTQTDDYACDCGKPLIPKCLECIKCEEMDDSGYYQSGMRRSRGRQDLAAINKSELLLEAIERTSRRANAIDKCDTGVDNGSISAAVTENKCDSSDSSDKAINISNCNKDILNINNNCSGDALCVRSAFVFSDRFVKDNYPQPSGVITRDLTDGETTPSRYSGLVQNFDKAVDFIRKPKLKRLVPIVDKLDKIVMERNEQKKTSETCPEIAKLMSEHDEDFLYKDEASGITYMTNSNMESFPQDYNSNRVVLYEKGDFGNFVPIDSKLMGKHAHEDVENDGSQSSKHFRRNEDKSQESMWDAECQIINCLHERFDKIGSLDQSAVPSVSEMDRFRCRLDSAASMVFHARTGLPLTSSPAPLRRGKSCFDFDSSINSVSGIKSALYGLSPEIESELTGQPWSPGSSPGSPLPWGSPPTACRLATTFTGVHSGVTALHSVAADVTRVSSKRKIFRHGTTSGLLGSFEESVLNGRLEPAATVAGFTAEIGASGAFCPPHLKLPVTVFFYSLGDNTTSAPYLGHINLGRRGYCVPRAGTIQATLFNPHGTVVKMFVVMYDMANMPPNSRTFLRQRTLCVPAVADAGPPDPRALRYLIHLRFLSSKSGKIYLHTDIRIIVSRKADLDTAHSLNSAMALQVQDGTSDPAESRKKKTVETGTFERRTKNNLLTEVVGGPRIKRIFGGCEIDSVKKTMNRSEGSFELASYCRQNGVEDDNDEERDSPNVRSRSGSTSANYASKELSYELRSFTYGPDNPKYSPRAAVTVSQDSSDDEEPAVLIQGASTDEKPHSICPSRWNPSSTLPCTTIDSWDYLTHTKYFGRTHFYATSEKDGSDYTSCMVEMFVSRVVQGIRSIFHQHRIFCGQSIENDAVMENFE